MKNLKMGLGILGGNFGFVPKKKYRWLFQGFDCSNNKIVESFVKVSHRPHFGYMVVADENGGKEMPIPDTIGITMYFTFYDEKGKAAEEFKKVFDKHSEVVSAKLTSLDGCGVPLEEWNFQDLIMALNPLVDTSNEDDIIAEWNLKYQKSDWALVENENSIGFAKRPTETVPVTGNESTPKS